MDYPQLIKIMCKKIIKLKDSLINIGKGLKQHNIGEYSAQCAYYIVLSFIPLLMLVVTLIQYIGISSDKFQEIVQNIIPSTMYQLSEQIIQEVYSKSIGTVSISAVFVILSARRGIYVLIKGLCDIYGTKANVGTLKMQLKSVVFTIAFVVVVSMVLVFSVFGNRLFDILRQNIVGFDGMAGFIDASKVAVYFILFVFILLVYRWLPYHKGSIFRHIQGAFLACLGWYVVSLFFSMYLDIFKGFSIMYGSLNTIILSMMWIYACVYIIFCGAEVNAMARHQNRRM